MQIDDTLHLRFSDRTNAEIFLNSFQPEMASMPMKRSSWSVSQNSTGETLIFHITAADPTAYRATINAVIQMVHVVDRTIQILTNSGCDKN